MATLHSDPWGRCPLALTSWDHWSHPSKPPPCPFAVPHASEFDAGKHSCRKQLEKHNARRRKRQQQGAEGAAAGPSPPAQQASQAAGQRAKRSRGKAAAAPAAGAEAGAAPAAATAGACAAAAVLAAAAQPAWPQAQQAPSGGPEAAAPGEPASADALSSLSASAAGSLAVPSAGARPRHATAPAQQAAAEPLLLEPTASLSLLDFELDSLEPLPYPDVFPPARAAPLHSVTGSDLADELAAWLNSNLAEDEASAAAAAQGPRSLAPPPPLQQHGWHAPAPAGAPAGWLPLQPQQSTSLQYGQAIMHQDLLPVDPLLYGQAPAPLQHPPWAAQQGAHGGPAPDQAAPAAPPVALGVPVAAPLAAQAQPEPVQHGPSLSGGDTRGTGAAPASSMTHALTGSSAGAPAAAGHGSPPPTLSTVSVKLFGCTPAELPQGLRDHLK